MRKQRLTVLLLSLLVLTACGYTVYRPALSPEPVLPEKSGPEAPLRLQPEVPPEPPWTWPRGLPATAVQCDLAPGNPDYGYQWWVQSFGGYDAYFAQGHFGQFIFVVPALELVAAVTSHNTGGSDLYWQLIRSLAAACRE